MGCNPNHRKMQGWPADLFFCLFGQVKLLMTTWTFGSTMVRRLDLSLISRKLRLSSQVEVQHPPGSCQTKVALQDVLRLLRCGGWKWCTSPQEMVSQMLKRYGKRFPPRNWNFVVLYQAAQFVSWDLMGEEDRLAFPTGMRSRWAVHLGFWGSLVFTTYPGNST